MISFFLTFLAFLFGATLGGDTVGYQVSEVSGFHQIASQNQSILYQLQLQQFPHAYDNPVLLLDLHGKDHFEMGYAYGKLLAKNIQNLYENFFQALLHSSGLKEELEVYVLAQILDWQWNDYLSLECPQEYLDEIAGIKVGGHESGVPDLDKLVTRVAVLANLPGDAKDIIFVLLREWQEYIGVTPFPVPPVNGEREGHADGLLCSMFGIWGNRTRDGSLWTARNLDWAKDTGIANHKLITVYHPPGGHSYATFGYTGLIGALTGMSSQGLTVHEANLESNEDTFFGFPWILRLRYIMDNAKNLDEAVQIMRNTNNTAGFNFGIGSASDNKFMVFETMAQYTAYFHDNDSREANAIYHYPKTGQRVHIGAPVPEALWRTNNGYDPKIREHFPDSQSPTSWTVERYFFMADSFKYYNQNQIQVDLDQALNVTAIVGDKGRESPFKCGPTSSSGTNVLSATYHPGSADVWVAWENGTGKSWSPAACNTYVHVNLKKFF